MYRDRDAPPPKLIKPPALATSDPHHSPEGFGYEPQSKRGRGGTGDYQGAYRNNYNGRPQWGGRGRKGQGQDRNWNNPQQSFYNGRPPHPHHHNSRHPRPFSNFGRGRGGHVRHNFQANNQNDHVKDSPWMTPELLKLIQEKEDLWKICSETRSEDDHRNFKIKRFEVNMAVNDAKLLFHQQNPQFGNSYTQVFRRTVKNTEFYCEPCDKEFISEVQLEEHKTEHITCKLDGCTYTAHVKLVMKHIEIQHSTNLFQRIKGYDTPEEIEKWKQERKKNFPTPENIVRKKAEIAERRARGESLTAKEDFPGIEVFRHKIIPEERKPRRNNFQHGGYQSEGDEDVLPAYCLRPGAIRLMNFNSSPAIRLHNFYTDITLSNSGTLIASTRETWVNQCTEGVVEVNKHHENFDAAPDTEFNITDDEEDTSVQKLGTCSMSRKISESQTSQWSSIDTGNSITPSSISEERSNSTGVVDRSLVKFVTDLGNISGTGKRLPGLVSYGSEVDSDVEEDGELQSDDEVQNTLVPIIPSSVVGRGIDHPVPSDDEAPDELPAIKTKEPDIPINSSYNDNNIMPKSQDRNSKSRSDFQTTKKSDKMGKSSGVFKSLKKVEKRTSQPQTHVQKAQSVRRKYTLLQRLLAPDIRKEKNMVLQVCRFLVDRNFLDAACPVQDSDTNLTPIEELSVLPSAASGPDKDPLPNTDKECN